MEAVGQGLLLEWSCLCIFGSIENAIDNCLFIFFLSLFCSRLFEPHVGNHIAYYSRNHNCECDFFFYYFSPFTGMSCYYTT